MKNNLISVIIPVYNVEKYLERCIDSVINQTYSNLEIILIDDGSTDKSSMICDKYKNIDKRIVAIHQKNCGVSIARNNALNIAKGDYVTFIDSDDYIKHDMIETLLNELIENNLSYVACGYAVEKNNIKDVIAPTENRLFVNGYEALENFFEQNNFEMNMATVWGVYNMDVFKCIKFKNDIYFEDFEIMPYILSNCKKIMYLAYTGYIYFYNPDSITNGRNETHRKKLYLDSIDILEEHLDFYKKNEQLNLLLITQKRLVEKILTHCINNDIPIGLEDFSKKKLKDHISIVRNNKISSKLKIIYIGYYLFGNNFLNVYKYIKKIIKKEI